MSHVLQKALAQIVVLDTNIVLDLFLFQDPRTEPLRQQLQAGQLQWRATAHMRKELERVLTYTHIAAKLAFYQKSPQDILTQFDQYAQLSPQPSGKAPYICKDADDQVFIDLAAALATSVATSLAIPPAPPLANPIQPLQASPSPSSTPSVILISKDKAVLSLRKRLEKLTIRVTAAL
jgi:predicted nucleic acid-binding protein